MSSLDQMYESVNAHVEAADLTQFEVVPQNKSFSDGAATSNITDSKLCGIYKVVRPILKLVTNLPIIPGKWRKAVQVFCDVLDSICGN